MFKIFINGELFGKSDDEMYFVSNPSVKLELNKAGSFNCIIYPNHPFYDRLQKMTSYVDVYLKDEKIFSGRLLHTETDTYGQKSCYFEGELSYFIDTVVTPGEFEETLFDHFKRIVDEHNSQVGPEKQFEVGVVDMDETDKQFFSSSSYRDSQSVLTSDLISIYGGYLWVRDFGGTRYLDYVKSYDRKNEQKLEVGKNVLDITDYVSGEDIFTVLLPIGPTSYSSSSRGSEDRTQSSDIMTIASVNGGNKFLENDELVRRYGRIVKIQNFQNAESPADLLKRAKEWMEENADGVPDSLTVKAIDLHLRDSDISMIRIGDLVEAFSKVHGIRKDLVCTAIDYDLADPKNTSYTIGSAKQTLSEQYVQKTTSISSSVDDIDFSIGSIDSQIEQNMQDLDDLTFEMEDFETDFSDYQDEMEKALDDINSNIGDIEDNFSDFETKFDEFEKEVDESFKDVEDSFKDVEDQFKDVEDSFKDVNEKVETNSSSIRQNTADIAKNSEELEIKTKKITADVEELEIKAGRITADVEELEIKAERITTDVEQLEIKAGLIDVNATAIQANIEAIAVNSREIKIATEKLEVKADRIELDAYVTISELEANIATINKFFSGTTTATNIVTDNLGINNHFNAMGHQAEWKSEYVAIGINNAADRTVNRTTINYLDHSNAKQSVSVITDIYNLNSKPSLEYANIRWLGF